MQYWVVSILYRNLRKLESSENYVGGIFSELKGRLDVAGN
jgi:hypothetical protein